MDIFKLFITSTLLFIEEAVKNAMLKAVKSSSTINFQNHSAITCILLNIAFPK